MTWIHHPLILEGEKVILKPLNEDHFDGLIKAGREEVIWTYMPVIGTDADELRYALSEAITKREMGEQYPFVVIDKANGSIIGSTRFLKLGEEHRNLEIGWTWYSPEYWGKGYNEECKLLLLTHCFEVLKTIRVQIVAAERNMRSRKAIERIGATFEGVLRSVLMRYDGKRSVAYYSIIEEDWPAVRSNLQQLVKQKIK